MTQRLFLAFLLSSSAVANAATTEANLRAAIAARDWQGGVGTCAGVQESEARRRDAFQLAASHYAEVAALCAAAASGAGDLDSAEWWWFTAAALDLETANRLLPELRSEGLLERLAPPRRAAGAALDPKPSAPSPVTLPDGTTVAGDPVQVTLRPRPPAWMHLAARYGPPTKVAVEMLIDEEGTARQPLLVSAKARPIHTFLTFSYFRQWRFAPARVDGKAVPSAFAVTLSAHRAP